MKKIAIILAGCGNKDGAEVTEVVSTLISITQNGAEYKCFAPNVSFDAQNFITNKPMNEKRNLLTEAARLARGDIQDLKDLNCEQFDALILPGGFGAALHLSNWAQKGSHCEVHPEVKRVIETFYKLNKPIGAICIAPTLLAKVLGSKKITLTIGHDKETAQEITKTGAQHVSCPVDDYITDREHKIVTTPAYMEPAKPHQVFKGVSGLVKEIVEMA